MKRLSVFIATIATVSIAGTVLAAAPRPHRGDVTGASPDTYNASWVTGVSRDGGAKAQSIQLGDHSTDATDFAYYSFRNWWDQLLVDVIKIRASFKAAAGATNGGGSPRISLEVEDVAGGSSTGIIYLDPAWCSDPASGGWRDADFTGDLTNCSIFDSAGHQYTSAGRKSAWSKLVADPYYTGKRVYFAYAIADATTGANYVDRIYLDSALFTSKP
jgi:hypothetical protein